MVENRRTERIRYIIDFMTAAQAAERCAKNRRGSGANYSPQQHDDDVVTVDQMVPADDAAIVDRMWTAEKTLRQLSTSELSAATHNFAMMIHRAVWIGTGTVSVPEFIRPSRNAFLEAAKRDLSEAFEETAMRAEGFAVG